jgi:uncharacterized membrane-anchored protein YhcB (DUF1043 family)
MKFQQLTIGLIIGVSLGFAGSRLTSDLYTIQVMNGATALKINKRTGESWRFDRVQNHWNPISEKPVESNTNSTPKGFIPDSN